MSEPTSIRTPSSLDQPLCRAALYQVLSLGLQRPGQSALDTLRSSDTKAALLAAASLVESAVGGEASTELSACLKDWLQAADSLTLDVWQSVCTRMFGHTARGLVCPYETEYGLQGLFEQPRQLARILGFYRAFGLEMAAGIRERADHASVELEFLAFLCRKEAVAIELNDQETLEETRKGIRLFLRDHVSRFACAFARLLQDHDSGGFHGKLGGLLHAFVTLECRSLGVRPGPALLQLRPEEDDATPLACGGSDELVQLRVPS